MTFFCRAFLTIALGILPSIAADDSYLYQPVTQESQELRTTWDYTDNQPLVGEIWNLAQHYSTDAYIDAFKKLGCFNFSDNPDIQDAFFNKIRTIAANPAGRILLFRLLVELQRPSTGLEGKLGRDKIKKIMIIEDNDKPRFAYSKEKSTLYTSLSIRKIYIFSVHDDQLQYQPGKPDTDDIYLFHEMLHWFHSLADLEHYDPPLTYEKLQQEMTHLDLFDMDKIKNGLIQHKISQNKSSKQSPREKEESANAAVNKMGKQIDGFIEDAAEEWGAPIMEDYTIEEIYTILSNPTVAGFGLSENLYRLLGGYELRLYYRAADSEKTNYLSVQAIRAYIILQIEALAKDAKKNSMNIN